MAISRRGRWFEPSRAHSVLQGFLCGTAAVCWARSHSVAQSVAQAASESRANRAMQAVLRVVSWRYREGVTRLDRITTDPAVCHGQPTIRGLRYTVESVLELLAAGMTVDEVLADYPDLERDDILAALEFGARAAGRRVVPLSAA